MCSEHVWGCCWALLLLLEVVAQLFFDIDAVLLLSVAAAALAVASMQ